MDLYDIRRQLNMGKNLTNISLRVTDYARVSTDSFEQKKSLQNQVEHFAEYIKKNPNWIYVPGYIDAGITGTSDIKRDNFMQMIDDARSGKFDLIITKEISRFSRNTLDSIKYTRELLSYGVAVLFVNDNINTALPDSELRLTIMASMAQDEIRRLSERVKFGMNRAIQRGEILGNNWLYGYRKNQSNGLLEIVEDEAKIVQSIFEYYAIKGLSLSKIVNILNSKNIKSSQNKKWYISTISRMIQNPKYKGFYCGKKSEIIDYMTKKVKYFKQEEWISYKDKVKIPPIISEELWEKANYRLIDRKKEFKQRRKNKTFFQNRYLYSAKIFCNDHKSIFYRRVFRKKKKDVSWVCSSYLKNGKLTGNCPNIRESELSVIFKDLITKLNINIEKIFEILGDYYHNFKNNNDVNEMIGSLKKELKSISLKKETLLELRLQNSLSNKEFYKKNSFFNERIREINQEIDKIRKTKNALLDITNKEEIIKKIAFKFNENILIDKIISCLLDHMMVNSISNNKNNIQLNIYLTSNYMKNKSSLINNNYVFKRGYDTCSTKRYEVYYKVNFFWL